MTSQPIITHLSGGDSFLYPAAGDSRPPGGAKVLLLTMGCVCVTGTWSDNGLYLGWAPLPTRNHEKEALINGNVQRR